MKAVLFHNHGGPEVLQCTDIETPEPGPEQVLVRLKFAALNRLDLWVRQGWPGIRLAYPHIPGADGAGKIAALGERVNERQVGEQVVINSNLGCGECDFCIAGQDNRCQSWELLGETRRGTYAEYVAIPASHAYPIPAGFPEEQAAAAALVFHTAWHSLIERGQLRPGESVLVVGATGGVNSACIQIAKATGATVFVVGSGSSKLAVAESLGADFLIDRSQETDWSKAVIRLTRKRGIDVVVDNVGTTYPLSFRAARKGGRILTVGNTGGAKFEIDNRYIFGKHLSLLGSTMGTRADFRKVMEMVFAGHFKAVIDRTFPLAEAAAAHERMEKGEHTGKITLAIG